jgi:16S rRNA (guanine527-N7)-methyltransferase
MTRATLPEAAETASAADRAQATALFGESVSRETWARLDALVAMLLERQRVMNLIAASTIPTLWTRHVADSLQLLTHASAARRWIDLGSGAGFPGLVIACALAGTPGSEVHLVESRKKKAAFLQDVVDALSLPALVHPARIEDFDVRAKFDVVTARALAPLTKLIGYAIPLLKSGAIGLFPKGQDVEAELTEASKSWKLDTELIPSVTDPLGRIAVVRRAVKR